MNRLIISVTCLLVICQAHLELLDETRRPSLETQLLYPFDPEPLKNDFNDDLIEDEIEYFSNSQNDNYDNYDFSPPNGQLPDGTNIKMAGPLTSYLNGNRNNDENLLDNNVNNMSFQRKKKGQVLCRVQKTIHHHNEAGYDFFPKSFTSYSCHPVTPSNKDVFTTANHDVCLVTSKNKCSSLQMKRFFLRRNSTNTCWSDLISLDVNSGCDCLYHYNYRIHL
ncbi:uncharacterized protein LOC143202264 isoform X1 [Rhynchophorus ferrugineus]|uniref:uncharacterized protein LOC143202264 isoform X1 n=1 Tax=Rhynchophorus ferrugineus TaxID=354439 RepID=UPI003FCD29EB